MVCVIRSMSGVLNLSNAEIGRRVDLPRTTVRDINKRHSWRNIPPSDPETVERLVRELKEWHECQAESVLLGVEPATLPQDPTAGNEV
jgi:hypothetical protein